MYFLEEGRRYLPFRLIDESDQPITGATLGDFQLFFRRDGVDCSDSVSLAEWGSGRYSLSYVPSASGTDYLEAYHPVADIRVVDIENVVDGVRFFETVIGAGVKIYDLTHNWGGMDNLRVTLPQPQIYALSVYRSSDWNQNKRSDNDAVGSTSLDTMGRWLNAIPVIAGTYHLVVKKFRDNIIIKPNLEVPGTP